MRSRCSGRVNTRGRAGPRQHPRAPSPDLMFPGTGSLQRRARYFFFVPWMNQILEAERVSSAQIGRRSWQFEVKLINALAESDDKEGIIGIQKRAALQRFPSSIYWNGLRRLGIRLFQGTQEDYYRGLDQFHQQTKQLQRDDDGEPVRRVPRTGARDCRQRRAGFQIRHPRACGKRRRTISQSGSRRMLHRQCLPSSYNGSIPTAIARLRGTTNWRTSCRPT